MDDDQSRQPSAPDIGSDAEAEHREKGERWPHRMAALGQVGSALGVLAAVWIARAQYDTSERQLKVMETQMQRVESNATQAENDTKVMLENAANLASRLQTLADAATRQLKISKGQAAALESQASSLSSQAREIGNQTSLVARQADAMRDQAKSLSVQAESSQAQEAQMRKLVAAANRGNELSEERDRPLLHVAVSLTRLEFPAVDRGKNIADWPPHDVFVRADVKIKNIGGTVVNDARVRMRVVLISPRDEESAGTVLKDTAKDLCVDTSPGEPVGTLFTGQEITKLVHDANVIRPADVHEPIPPILQKNAVHLAVAGCVTYTFVNSPATHKTWFTYRIVKSDPKHRELNPYDLVIGRTQQGRSLSLQPAAIADGGNGAD